MNSNASRAIEYVLSQTRENISFLLSIQQISSEDARDILNKLPTSPLKLSDMERSSYPIPDIQINSLPPTKIPVNPLTTRQPPPIPAPFLFKAKAQWGYNEDRREPNDLTFTLGDIIEVTDDKNADWWTGRLNGKAGTFPASYVQRLPRDPPLPSRPISSNAVPPSPNFPSPNFPKGPAYNPPNSYPQQNNYYAPHPPPPPPQGSQIPIYQTAPPPPNAVFVPVQTTQEPEKKSGFFNGGLKNTLAHSAVGGVGFGAGSAVGSGIINSIF